MVWHAMAYACQSMGIHGNEEVTEGQTIRIGPPT